MLNILIVLMQKINVDLKNTIYYFYFSGVCDRRTDKSPIFGPGMGVIYKPYSQQIAKADGWGYEHYYNGGGPGGYCYPGIELDNSLKAFEKKYDPKSYTQREAEIIKTIQIEQTLNYQLKPNTKSKIVLKSSMSFIQNL